MGGRVLITGACGFVGQHLVRQFAAKGYAITAADQPQADFAAIAGPNVTALPADILETDKLAAALVPGQLVVHAAGIFDYNAPYQLMEKVNILGAAAIGEAARRKRVGRFLHFSSTSVFGTPRRLPLGVDSPKEPATNYEISKWRGEQEVASLGRDGLPLAILRPTLIYGPGSRYGFAMYLALFAVVRHHFPKLPMPLVRGGPISQLVHVEDVARAAVYVAEAPAEKVLGRVFHVAAPFAVSQEYMYRGLFTGLEMPFIPADIRYRPILTYITGAFSCAPDTVYDGTNHIVEKLWTDLAKAYSLTDALRPRIDRDWTKYMLNEFFYETRELESIGFTFAYPDFVKGMVQTVAWYREHNWLP